MKTTRTFGQVFACLLFATVDAAAQDSATRVIESAQEYTEALEQFKKERAEQIDELQKRDAETLASFDGCRSEIPSDRKASISRTSPLEYPESAERANQQGLVVICVEVSSDGSVARKGVIQSSLFSALDEAALRAVEGWTFASAKDEQGVAIDDYVQVPINFALE
jgi:TonB family protein